MADTDSSTSRAANSPRNTLHAADPPSRTWPSSRSRPARDLSSDPRLGTTELDQTDLELNRPERADFGLPVDFPGSRRDVLRRRAAACDPPGRATTSMAEGRFADVRSGHARGLTTPRSSRLAAGLLLPIEPAPLVRDQRSIPPPWEDRLTGVLGQAGRTRSADPTPRSESGVGGNRSNRRTRTTYRALQLEYRRLMNQRPDTEDETRVLTRRSVR